MSSNRDDFPLHIVNSRKSNPHMTGAAPLQCLFLQSPTLVIKGDDTQRETAITLRARSPENTTLHRLLCSSFLSSVATRQ